MDHHPLRGQKSTTITKISIRRAVIVNRTCSFFHSKHSFYNDRRRWASFTVLNFPSVIFIPRKTLDQKRRWVPFGVDSINSISPNITNIPTVSLHSLVHLFFLKKSSSKEKLLPSVCFSLDLLQHTKPKGFYRFFFGFFFHRPGVVGQHVAIFFGAQQLHFRCLPTWLRKATRCRGCPRGLTEDARRGRGTKSSLGNQKNTNKVGRVLVEVWFLGNLMIFEVWSF